MNALYQALATIQVLDIYTDNQPEFVKLHEKMTFQLYEKGALRVL